MADLFPDTGLFDELEFLRFSDEQFASEVVLPEDASTQQLSLFSAERMGSTESHTSDLSGSPALRTLTELKAAVASCTVGIYRSPEPEENDSQLVGYVEKTLNRVVSDASDRDALSRKISWSYDSDSSEEADVTSPVSFSAVSEIEMSPAEASGLVQSAEVSQTTSAAVAIISRPQQRKLKVKMSQPTPLSSQVRTPLSSQVSTPLQSRVRSYSRSSVVDCGRPTLKRKLSVTGSEAAELAKFKSTKRTKKYMQRPYEDPDLERTRLNAINAKRNRERKKQEMMVLAEKCDSLSEENKELDRSNRSLEQRLQAAEEEIAFLRRALLGQVGSERPALSEAIKSLTGGSSAPAG